MAEAEKKAPAKETSKAAPKKKEKTIEELAAMQNLRPSILAGMKAHYGWAEGKSMTVEEFNKLKEKWLKAPVNRRK